MATENEIMEIMSLWIQGIPSQYDTNLQIRMYGPEFNLYLFINILRKCVEVCESPASIMDIRRVVCCSVEYENVDVYDPSFDPEEFFRPLAEAIDFKVKP